jgi:F0F1-type ATP synthase epsilon subunit
MSEGTFQLKVFSGKGLEVEATVAAVTVRSEIGELGFLENHCDYVGLLSTGFAQYATGTDTAMKRCLVSGGICTFKNNTLTLLADTVDLPESFDRALLEQDTTVLEAQLGALSLFDPEWDLIAQKVARIQALKTLA